VNNDGHFIFRGAAKHRDTARAVDINALKFGVELQALNALLGGAVYSIGGDAVRRMHRAKGDKAPFALRVRIGGYAVYRLGLLGLRGDGQNHRHIDSRSVKLFNKSPRRSVSCGDAIYPRHHKAPLAKHVKSSCGYLFGKCVGMKIYYHFYSLPLSIIIPIKTKKVNNSLKFCDFFVVLD
jgi:hypothetical protein